MCRECVDILAEKLLYLPSIIGKKFLKFHWQQNKVPSINQMMILDLINEEGTMSISEIGKKIGISKPQMTIIIDKLIGQGLVQRSYNEADRRIINIHITNAGKQYHADVAELFKSNISEKLSALDKETLMRLLSSIEVTTDILRNLE